MLLWQVIYPAHTNGVIAIFLLPKSSYILCGTVTYEKGTKGKRLHSTVLEEGVSYELYFLGQKCKSETAVGAYSSSVESE